MLLKHSKIPALLSACLLYTEPHSMLLIFGSLERDESQQRPLLDVPSLPGWEGFAQQKCC